MRERYNKIMNRFEYALTEFERWYIRKQINRILAITQDIWTIQFLNNIRDEYLSIWLTERQFEYVFKEFKRYQIEIQCDDPAVHIEFENEAIQAELNAPAQYIKELQLLKEMKAYRDDLIAGIGDEEPSPYEAAMLDDLQREIDKLEIWK